MKLEGNYTFDAPRQTVWEMFFEPEILAKTMPGCEKLELVGEHTFEGKMRVQVGPVQGIFQGTVVLSNLHPPESYHMKVNGRGPAGFMDGEGDVRLEESVEGTIMHYRGDAHVGGRIAQVGQRLMDSSARAIVKQSLENLSRQVAARQNGGDLSSENGEAGGPAAPTQTEFAVGVAREMMGEFVPPERQSQFLVGAITFLGAILAFRVFVEWWSDLLARKIARNLREKGG